VTAVDLSPTAVAEARKELCGREPRSVEVVQGDFFEMELPTQHFACIWDCTFLCALSPDSRERWAARTAALLAPDGELWSLVFPIIEKVGGPPYALSVDLVSSLLEPHGLLPEEVVEMPNGTHMPRLPAAGNTVVKYCRRK
jgi:hypothetical protein